MGTVDPAFKVITKGTTAFLIWRIEKLQVVPLPREQYGSFYTGDSYIIYSVREVRGSLDMRIHFWLGSHTSQDEAGVAAYKTVELDDYLGGAPVQHREVEGRESHIFRSYFKNGIRYLEGGVASGFNHVENVFRPKLFHIKGKRKSIIREMPHISWEFFNDGDVFVLDLGIAIYVWNGKYANKIEKIRGAQVAQKLKSEHGGSTVIILEDGEEQAMHSNEKELFNQYLSLSSKKVKSHNEVPHDDVIERKHFMEIKLYRCSDEGGTLKVTEVKSGPLEQKDLDSNDSFIVDNGEAGIWVWVGKSATKKERAEAMRNAQGFIKKKGYPNYTQVTRVIDGGEPMEFKCLFHNWRSSNMQLGLGKTYNIGKIAKTVQTKFDASTLHSNIKLAAESQMVDDGTGKKKIWRVENFDIVPLDPKLYGQFFGGDCYIIFYTYEVDGRINYIIYYWLGKKSTQDERGTAALKTVELDRENDGKPVEVRVVQGKEPPHFMAIFEGKMIVFEGGKASGFRNANAQDEGPGDCYLLHVRGTSSMNTKAIQVERRAASLNSNDVFVLFTKPAVYVWAGKGSTGDEREMAKLVASKSPRDPIMVYEGQEKNDFWDAIGGKEPYSNDKRLQEESSEHAVRLFQCSNASGRFLVEELDDFDQSDLIEDDVMLLDAYDALFIWIGLGANEEEKKLAEQMAYDYLVTDPSGRDLGTPIIRTKQGFEPPNFTGFFGVWDTTLWNNSKTYEEIKTDLMKHNSGIEITQPQTNGSINSLSEVAKYPLEILQEKDPEKLPDGVDPSCKELHLTDNDFERVFKMKHSEFLALPAWRQVSLKKAASLF